jgi:hypothetical protein
MNLNLDKPSTRTDLILCVTFGCDQVLARVGECGDVYPSVVGAFLDKDGRLCVVCPACNRRNRLPTRRKAA